MFSSCGNNGKASNYKVRGHDIVQLKICDEHSNLLFNITLDGTMTRSESGLSCSIHAGFANFIDVSSCVAKYVCSSKSRAAKQ